MHKLKINLLIPPICSLLKTLKRVAKKPVETKNNNGKIIEKVVMNAPYKYAGIMTTKRELV